MFLPLQLLLGSGHFLCYVEFVKVCAILLCLQSGCVWHNAVLIVDILASMSNVIKYILKKKAWHFSIKKSVAVEVTTQLWLANVLITPTAVPILLVSVLFARIFTCSWERTKWKSIKQTKNSFRRRGEGSPGMRIELRLEKPKGQKNVNGTD